jgi:hypothetical protein
MHWHTVRLTALFVVCLSTTVVVAMNPQRTRTTIRRYTSLLAASAREGGDSGTATVATGAAPARAASPRTPARVKSESSTAGSYHVPIGTVVSATLRTPIDSSTSEVNSAIDAVLTEAVTQDGVELIPVGSVFHGTLIDVEAASQQTPLGRATIAFAVVQHAESRSRAPFRTRPLAFEARSPAEIRDAHHRAKQQPIDLVLPAGHPLRLTLDEPLLVVIPGTPPRSR